MNEAPDIIVEHNKNGRGFVLMFRPCHKVEYAPLMKGGGEPRVFHTRVEALMAAIDQIIRYGWPHIVGTQDAIPKRHTVETVFEKGA